MSKHWLTGEDRKVLPSPFGVHYYTSVPSNSVGADGDYCFLYGNDTDGVLKKIDGVWYAITGNSTYFQGFNSKNSQIVNIFSPVTDLNITSFSFTDLDNLRVEVDGIVQYEGASYGYTRDTLNQRITFTEPVEATGSSSVRIVVGKYTGTGFAGFDLSNSQLTAVTTEIYYVPVTAFAFDYQTQFSVEVDGVVQYENQGWIRNVNSQLIVFTENLPGSSDNPVTVFIGKYN